MVDIIAGERVCVAEATLLDSQQPAMPAVSRDSAISDTSKNSALRKGVLRQPMRCGEQKARFYKEKQWVVLCVAEIF